MEWPLAEVEALTKAELGPLEDILKEHGIETTIGG